MYTADLEKGRYFITENNTLMWYGRDVNNTETVLPVVECEVLHNENGYESFYLKSCPFCRETHHHGAKFGIHASHCACTLSNLKFESIFNDYVEVPEYYILANHDDYMRCFSEACDLETLHKIIVSERRSIFQVIKDIFNFPYKMRK